MAALADVVNADSVSEAWVLVLEGVDATPGHHAFHVVVRIARPTGEIKAIRGIADQLLGKLKLPSINTVRNTVFPAEVAKRYPDPEDLTSRYREHHYPRLRKLAKANAGGTYFGRIAEFPTAVGAMDQLVPVVDKLRRSKKGKRRKATYEMDLGEPGLDIGLYRHGKDDKKTMAFPCLSFCSFQLDGERVHLVANYRSQYLVQRAYGNYLGLGELLAYVSRASGFEPGELLVVAGHARIDAPLGPTRAALTQARKALDVFSESEGG